MSLGARFRLVLAAFAIFTAAANASEPAYRLARVYPDLQLSLPVSLLPLGDGSQRILVVQLDGLVVLLEDGVVRERPFLSLRTRVTALAGEQGLYSVALESAEDATATGRPRRLVAAFSEVGSGDLVVATYETDEQLSEAHLDTERVVLRVPMPEPFHYGGQVAFAADGSLFISVGNGERDPAHALLRPASAQSLSELRGKLLRVRLPQDAVDGYAAPSDNPYAGGSGGASTLGNPQFALPEIYASGFRNPWKFSIDYDSGRLLLADVGEDRWEEINLVVPGGNYGWPAREGRECQRRLDGQGVIEPECEALPFEDPLIVYGHPGIDPDGGSAVVGGVIVRDPNLPELAGRYLYADFVFGRVWAYDFVTGTSQLLAVSGTTISSITATAAGEILLASLAGELLRLEPVAP